MQSLVRTRLREYRGTLKCFSIHQSTEISMNTNSLELLLFFELHTFTDITTEEAIGLKTKTLLRNSTQYC